MDYSIKQGDQYLIPFYIRAGKYVLDPEHLDEVIISFGPTICKSWTKQEIYWNATKHCFECPLLQAETAQLSPGTRLQSQVRYKIKQYDSQKPIATINSYDGPSIVITFANNKETI